MATLPFGWAAQSVLSLLFHKQAVCIHVRAHVGKVVIMSVENELKFTLATAGQNGVIGLSSFEAEYLTVSMSPHTDYRD